MNNNLIRFRGETLCLGSDLMMRFPKKSEEIKVCCFCCEPDKSTLGARRERHKKLVHSALEEISTT